MTRNKFGLDICPPSIKFEQCQTVLRNALKNSPNAEINELWKTTSTNKNIQYDVYTKTKEVIKAFRSNQETKLQDKLSTQGSFFNSISKFALSQLTNLWSVAQSSLPKNIFNFNIRYINNSLPTRQTCLDGIYLLFLIAVDASKRRHSFMSSRGAIHILTDSLGVMTLF